MEILAPLFGIFTSVILFYYLISLNRSNLFLSLFFFCCNLIVLVYFGLHFTKNLFWEGVCFVNFLPLSYLLGPLMFYYVKNTVSENVLVLRTHAPLSCVWSASRFEIVPVCRYGVYLVF